LDLIKASDERKTLDTKRNLERFKTEYEISSIHAKRDYDSHRYEMERRSNQYKANYEETRYERDTFLEGLKVIGAVAGVVAGGYVLYSKMSK
jgi:hypothetical protein